MTASRLTICLWFNFNAEQAVRHYLSIFEEGTITSTARYTGDGPGPAGAVMTIAFEFAGQSFLALNGGPQFPFTPATSIVVHCDNQQEIDRYWELLSEGGAKGRCGWLTDKFGLSWQVVPRAVERWMTTDPERATRVMKAVLNMDKLDINELERAYGQ